MSKNHNQSQIHVRNSSGKFRPGTTTPPAEAEANTLSPNEQSYLAQASKTPTDPSTISPSLEAVDIVEIVTGTMHTDEGDSVDPSDQG